MDRETVEILVMWGIYIIPFMMMIGLGFFDDDGLTHVDSDDQPYTPSWREN